MMKVIYELGRKSLEENEDAYLQTLTLPLPDKKTLKYGVILDFQNSDSSIHFILKELDERLLNEWCWIGKADGSNSPQWYGTVDKLDYLLSQTLTNLLEKWDQNDAFYLLLKETHEKFFCYLGPLKEKRYRYIFNPALIGEEIAKIGEASTKDDRKKAVAEITNKFQKYLEKEANVNAQDIGLYTISINGQLVVKQKVYKQLVVEEKLSKFHEAKEGVCSITNQKGLVTGDTTRLKFKYYINDKISFASNLDENEFVKNLSIGKEAYKCIQAGEVYILRNFDTRFSGLTCYVIPEFLYDVPFENVPLKEISNRVLDFVHKVKTIETGVQLQEEIEDFRLYEEQMDNQISLHFLFYTKSKSSLKVNKLLSDVPLNHLKKLRDEMRNISNIGRNFFPNARTKDLDVGLDAISKLIPTRIAKNENVEKRKILQVYESLLTNKTLSYAWLIQQFVLLARIHMYANYGSYQLGSGLNADQNDYLLVHALLRSQLFLLLLKKLQLVEEGKRMDGISYELPDPALADYMKEMAFSVPQSSLFLLGYLISRIAAAQVGKTAERLEATGQSRFGKTANKPILSKINFHGMNKQKIMMLSNEVFEKMKQLGINYLSNEAIYSEHRRLLDLALKGKWALSDHEGVYYLLSGYSYGTKRILERAKELGKEEAIDEGGFDHE
ncbi:MAG: type I-B CRISPR-associated protein Cas8b/Csh1 [Caldibacillus debilis]|uniref:type I-B CRISPR-associated protein Cas8b/Csh1 n=1 Tax=Caldibacillus debilis TaxID=301148 RepID=UPI000E3831C5|nr:type I-B CRISPR-associated protein Cas8b/Csh1 [Caldibacillus debilis]REJ16206.1 MAG: type I-B CRISPR-associated protein Cas8b/Csh1 [Caldibacillus debilis]